MELLLLWSRDTVFIVTCHSRVMSRVTFAPVVTCGRAGLTVCGPDTISQQLRLHTLIKFKCNASIICIFCESDDNFLISRLNEKIKHENLVYLCFFLKLIL